MIIWNLVIEQRLFKGTKMTLQQSQCLFFFFSLVLFSNIPRNINYKVSVLTTMIVLIWGVQDTFSPFSENTAEISGHSLQALRGKAEVWEGVGGRPPLPRPLVKEPSVLQWDCSFLERRAIYHSPK